MKHPLFDAYVEACNYPGKLNEADVESALGNYIKALGIQRKIVRLRQGWALEEHPSLHGTINLIINDICARTGYKPVRAAAQAARAALAARAARDARAAQAARAALAAQAARAALAALAAQAALAARDAQDARDALAAQDAQAARDARAAQDAQDARAARDALDARDAALLRFAKWCMQSRGWLWYNWEISWVSTTAIGAWEIKDSKVLAWSEPVLQAFISGCWLLFWTEDTLYWVAKPTVHVDRTNGNRRLHNAEYAAVESDAENLYFLNGVLVPAFVVVRPGWITLQHIITEENAEVRRIMLDRFGWDRFAEEGEFETIHRDEVEFQFPAIPVSEMVSAETRLVTTYRAGKEVAELIQSKTVMRGDGLPLTFVRLTDPSTGRRYHLRVDPNSRRAYEAVARSGGMTEKQYKESMYHRQGDVFLIPLGKTRGDSLHS